MSQGTGTIDKIKLIDGTIVDLISTQSIDIPDLAEVYINPEYDSFYGSVDLITGTEDEYLLTLPETRMEYHNIFDLLDKSTQTKNGCTLSYSTANETYTLDTAPSATSYFYIYENKSGFPPGLSPGDYIMFGSRTGSSACRCYAAYYDGSSWTTIGNGYSASALAVYQLPVAAVGIRFFISATTALTANTTTQPIILV